MTHEALMRQALEEAQKAFDEGEIPVGAVIARKGEVIARAHNLREQTGDPTAHAEMLVIRQAAQRLGGRRLNECTLYVTLEPCPMCAGAIVNARIPRVVYGAGDPKAGACGSVCSLFSMAFNHHPQVESGVMEEEAAALLRDFFRELRVTLRTRPKWRKRIDN